MILAVLTKLFESSDRAKTHRLEALCDEELMERFAGGDHRAFELLLRRNQQALFAFVFRYLGQAELAEEMVQEVFFRVVRVAQDYSKKAKFRTWLFTIARNSCIDHLRRRTSRPQLSLEQALSDEDDRSLGDLLADTQHVDARSEMLRREFRQRLEAALDMLPDEQREVFCMREFAALKFREIADIVGVSENTIKSRMRYALEQLREQLADYESNSFDREDASLCGIQTAFKAST